jgi:hypothetical protein
MFVGVITVILLWVPQTPRLDKLERRIGAIENRLTQIENGMRTWRGSEQPPNADEREVFEEVVRLKKELKECKDGPEKE